MMSETAACGSRVAVGNGTVESRGAHLDVGGDRFGVAVRAQFERGVNDADDGGDHTCGEDGHEKLPI